MAFSIFSSNTKAKAAEVNANFAFIAGGRLIAVDSSTGAAYGTFPIGDLTAVTNGSLVGNILVRDGAYLQIYNASGTLLKETLISDLAAPVGGVIGFAMTTVPTGWLECNGAAVSRTTYYSLYAAISTSWGVGDGSTTFKVPDYRGKFLRGFDNGAGVDSGRVFAASQAHALQAFTGAFQAVNQGLNTVSGIMSITSTGSVALASGGDARGYANFALTAANQVNTATETRPINQTVKYCIKY
jgi:phage-related tail fiber protein